MNTLIINVSKFQTWHQCKSRRNYRYTNITRTPTKQDPQQQQQQQQQQFNKQIIPA